MTQAVSEARRGMTRVASNYARLGSGIILGLLFVPLLISGVGEEGYGLWGLLGASIGLADIFREVVRSSMYRELGHAWHGPDPEHFREVYNTSLAISAGLAVLSALVFAGLYAAVPLLNVPPHWQGVARLMIVALGLNACATMLLGAPFNMYVVTERMVAFNFWTALERASYVAAALLVVRGPGDPGRALVLFTFLASGLSVLCTAAAVVAIVRSEPRLRPSPSHMSRRALRPLLGTGLWNGLVVLAMNLHIRLDQLIMNIAFGLFGNAVFSLAVTLTSYVRMLATGVTDGLEAVSVRISQAGRDGSLARLTEYSTRLHALVAFPAGLAVVMLAGPLLRTWVGRHVSDPAVVDTAATVVRILAIGFTSRAVSDSWVRILYGAGHIRRYAPLILAGGLANLPLAALLLFVLPDEWRLTGPALSFALILTAAHLLGLPVAVARCLRTSYWAVVSPMLRPLLITLACAPVYVVAPRIMKPDSLLSLGVVITTSGLLYGGLAAIFVVRPDERRRILETIRRWRSGRDGTRAASAADRAAPDRDLSLPDSSSANAEPVSAPRVRQ